MLKKVSDGLELYTDGSLYWLRDGSVMRGISFSFITKEEQDFIFLRGVKPEETKKSNMSIVDLHNLPGPIQTSDGREITLNEDQMGKPVAIVDDNDALEAALYGGG